MINRKAMRPSDFLVSAYPAPAFGRPSNRPPSLLPFAYPTPAFGHPSPQKGRGVGCASRR